MPRSLPRPCSTPGCPALSHARYCDKHQADQHKQQDARRGSSSSRGYDADWRRLRAWFLAQADNALCVHCTARGRVTPAVEVDHITPIARGGARLDPANLQPLCKPCHSAKTASENW